MCARKVSKVGLGRLVGGMDVWVEGWMDGMDGREGREGTE
jgi:hypothetical protein